MSDLFQEEQAQERRSWDDLPRDWLLAGLEMGRAADLKRWVLEAVQWGFDQPEGLTNNHKRIKWLRQCRERAWSLLSSGAAVPAPGKAQPADEKPKRSAPRPKPPRERVASAPAEPRRDFVPDDVFPGRPSAGRRDKRPRKVEADLCKIPATEVNRVLREMPAFESR